MIVLIGVFILAECGGTYFGSSGVLSSPLFPGEYPHGRDCEYRISQPDGAFVNINLIDVDINCQKTKSKYIYENTLGIPTDFIELRDGSHKGSPLIVKSCGNTTNFPTAVQSTQNHLWIRFLFPYRTD